MSTSTMAAWQPLANVAWGGAGQGGDVGGVAAEGGGGDLGERRLGALALSREAGGGEDPAARLDGEGGALVGPDPRAFHVAADPEAEVPLLASGLRLPAAKIAGTEPREHQLEAERVVAAIVASGAAVLERQPDVPRELVRLDKVAPPHLGGLE